MEFSSVCCECFIFIGYKEVAIGQRLNRAELSGQSRLRCKEKEKVGTVSKKSCNVTTAGDRCQTLDRILLVGHNEMQCTD